MTPVERQNEGGRVYAFRVTGPGPTRWYAENNGPAARWQAMRDGGGHPTHIVGISQSAHGIATQMLRDARAESLALERSFGVDSLMRRDP
jgi:hypothetical protein